MLCLPFQKFPVKPSIHTSKFPISGSLLSSPPPLIMPSLLLSLWTLLSQSKRIINAHSRHFLALSVLFLLPLSFAVAVHPILAQLHSLSTRRDAHVHRRYLLRLQPDPRAVAPETLLLTLLYSLFVFTLTLLGVGSVTYSVFHGFFGRPVKLLSAIRSAFVSFVPLLATSIVTLVLAIGFVAILGVFAVSAIKLYQLIEFEASYSSPCVASVLVILSVFLLLGLVCLAVNWNLACVIVVVESTWGLSPLKRSRNLVRGMRAVTVSLLLFFGFLAGVLIWSNSSLGLSGFGDKWKSWAFVVDIVVFSSFMTVLLLYNFAANLVLYMYCKAINGELAGEIAEEFAREYVSLPFDDGKVPHVVSVVHCY